MPKDLFQKSIVRMAGVSVGAIQSIALHEGKVKVHIKVKTSIQLRKSSEAHIRSSGILGDKYIDLKVGNLKDDLLKNGEQIPIVRIDMSFNQAFSSASRLMENLNESISQQGDRETVIGRILLNTERLTENLAELVEHNQGGLQDILSDLHESVKAMNYLINNPDTGLGIMWPKLSKNIDRSLQGVGDITQKINAGEGTIGQLVNDTGTIDRLNETLDSFNSLLGSAEKWETAFLVDSYYLGQKRPLEKWGWISSSDKSGSLL